MQQKLRQLLPPGERAAVARRIGMKPQQLSNILNYSKDINLRTAGRLSAALDVSLDWLADDESQLPPLRRSDFAAFHRLVPDQAKSIFDEMCLSFGSRAICLAAAVELLANADEPTRAMALVRAMSRERELAASSVTDHGEAIELIDQRGEEKIEGLGSEPLPADRGMQTRKS